jgi:3-oxoadipate enol-lactonase
MTMQAKSSPPLPVVERGDGPPVVFVHGYPLNHEIFAPQLESLSTDHHILLVDLPGFGLAKDSPVPQTLSGFAEEVGRTISARFTEPVVLVGHSFGGYIALELMRSHPEMIRALVLANTRAEADPGEAKEKRLATARRLENPSERLDAVETARSLVAEATWEAEGDVAHTVRALVEDAPSPAIIGSLRAMAGRPDFTPFLSSIEVPTLVIWGEADRLIPTPQTRALVARIRGSRGVGIARAGHLPSLETAAEFDRALTDHLARLAPEGEPEGAVPEASSSGGSESTHAA